MILLTTGGYLTVVTIRRWKDIAPETRRNLVLAAMLAATFAVIAFIPPTMWDQYWAMPVPFLATALAFPLAHLCKNADRLGDASQFRIARLVVLVGVLLTVSQNT